MKHKYKKSNLVISIILFVISAFFLGYGIYMIDYSIDYVRTYKEISSIALDNATQYVISSSYTYIGFAVLIFIGGFLIFSLRKTSCKIQPDNMIITNETDEDLHPENNPYFIASTESIPNEMKEIETTPDEIHSSNLFQKQTLFIQKITYCQIQMKTTQKNHYTLKSLKAETQRLLIGTMIMSTLK